jgi:hypothetical protein
MLHYELNLPHFKVCVDADVSTTLGTATLYVGGAMTV